MDRLPQVVNKKFQDASNTNRQSSRRHVSQHYENQNTTNFQSTGSLDIQSIQQTSPSQGRGGYQILKAAQALIFNPNKAGNNPKKFGKSNRHANSLEQMQPNIQTDSKEIKNFLHGSSPTAQKIVIQKDSSPGKQFQTDNTEKQVGKMNSDKLGKQNSVKLPDLIQKSKSIQSFEHKANIQIRSPRQLYYRGAFLNEETKETARGQMRSQTGGDSRDEFVTREGNRIDVFEQNVGSKTAGQKSKINKFEQAQRDLIALTDFIEVPDASINIVRNNQADSRQKTKTNRLSDKHRKQSTMTKTGDIRKSNKSLNLEQRLSKQKLKQNRAQMGASDFSHKEESARRFNEKYGLIERLSNSESQKSLKPSCNNRSKQSKKSVKLGQKFNEAAFSKVYNQPLPLKKAQQNFKIRSHSFKVNPNQQQPQQMQSSRHYGTTGTSGCSKIQLMDTSNRTVSKDYKMMDTPINTTQMGPNLSPNSSTFNKRNFPSQLSVEEATGVVYQHEQQYSAEYQNKNLQQQQVRDFIVTPNWQKRQQQIASTAISPILSMPNNPYGTGDNTYKFEDTGVSGLCGINKKYNSTPNENPNFNNSKGLIVQSSKNKSELNYSQIIANSAGDVTQLRIKKLANTVGVPSINRTPIVKQNIDIEKKQQDYVNQDCKQKQQTKSVVKSNRATALKKQNKNDLQIQKQKHSSQDHQSTSGQQQSSQLKANQRLVIKKESVMVDNVQNTQKRLQTPNEHPTSYSKLKSPTRTDKASVVVGKNPNFISKVIHSHQPNEPGVAPRAAIGFPQQTGGIIKHRNANANRQKPTSTQSVHIQEAINMTLNKSQLGQSDSKQAKTKHNIPSKDSEAAKYLLSDFQTLSVLGRGAFGHVSLVRSRKTDELFALKKLAKDKIRGNKHIQHVMNERNIMRSLSIANDDDASQSFFCKLIKSMQDETSLYLLLEYLPGGELLKQIKKQMSLTMQDSIFYLAEVLVGIKQLHERNIIYRDLKPENILLDKNGHVKLIDFGFSKQLQHASDRARTNCGTPQYAAPEVLLGIQYGFKADVWSFGILICELLGGFTPFGPNAMEIGAVQQNESPSGHAYSVMPPNKIIEMANSGRLILPKNLTPLTRDLVKRILVAEPEVRPDIRDIMLHKFFEGVDWVAVERRLMDPPYVPVVDEELNNIHSQKIGPPDISSSNAAEIQSDEGIIPEPYVTDKTQLNCNNKVRTSLEPAVPSNVSSKPISRFHVKSNLSNKSSPQVKRTTPKQILGDFHLTKINQVFQDF